MIEVIFVWAVVALILLQSAPYLSLFRVMCWPLFALFILALYFKALANSVSSRFR